jgi:prepilin peptidase CpaA
MIYAPSLDQIAVLLFAGLTVAAAISDVRSLIIPNRYSLTIALLYPIYVLTAPQPVNWLGGLAVGTGIIVVGFLFYARNWIGGGDAKLLAAIGLWAGPFQLIDFLFLTAIAGGIMSIILWLRHRMLRAPALSMIFTTETDQNFTKQPMPYGVAVSIGALYVAFTLIS